MDNRELLDEELQHLVIASLDGTATEEELLHLQAWLKESEGRMAVYADFRKQWLQAGRGQRYSVEEAWRKVEARMAASASLRKRLLYRWVGYAAAVALLIAGGTLYFSRQEVKVPVVEENITPGGKKAILVLGSEEKVELGGETGDKVFQGNETVKQEGNTLVYDGKKQKATAVEYNRLITPRGGEYSVVLSDGTKVWVNAESELKYPVHFAGGERRVYLKGEAYFEVTKREGQKFVVCSDEAEITVLGTEFNVKNYEDGAIATTLVNGSVVVGCEGEECRLEPGQQATISSEGMQVREVETILYTSWKDGFFVYRDMTLDDILKDLSRWYNFDYFYQNESLGELHLTARLRKFDKAEDVFEILSMTGKVNFVVKGCVVTVIAK